jgi:NAD(P)-dependent dehydrogenase (short-subunit alcohol dehydrogenase family)
MKIAITGHSAGIGQAFARIFAEQGHEIVGLDRRNGYNIRSVPKVAAMIEPCDWFINNAQVGFAQTELLIEVYRLWKDIPNKRIINISTIMTSHPVSTLPGLDMTAYRIQKKALEETHHQLRHLQIWPKLILIKPGGVATQLTQEAGMKKANVDEWANTVVQILELAAPNLEVNELALGVNYQ